MKPLHLSQSEDRLLTTAQVKVRLGGISDMSLWRWAHNPALAFPVPIMINGRKFYREAEIRSWELSRPRKRTKIAPRIANPASGQEIQ